MRLVRKCGQRGKWGVGDEDQEGPVVHHELGNQQSP